MDNLLDLIYFERWLEKKPLQPTREYMTFFQHVARLVRGGWQYMKKKIYRKLFEFFTWLGHRHIDLAEKFWISYDEDFPF